MIFLLLLPSYQSRTLWQKLSLKIVDEQGEYKKIIPAPPVNRYLTDDDLKLFQNIHRINFIAPPWKGLVIGVATDNFPFETKSATIANGILSYYRFMNFSCEEKKQIADSYILSYVYAEHFSCPFFKEIDKSSEGLYLYQYIE